ncbi:MAG TPA: hypothetical protein VGW33_01050 [Terriglobia bacterium]|nr:hypothetical protein [Terriglobia bacterium]
MTTAFTYYQNRRGERIKKIEIERRLDVEISNRMSSALARLRVDQQDIGQGRLYAPAAVYGDVASYLDNSFLNDPKDPQDFSIYPEYQKRSFRSLVFELSTIVDPSSLPELREAVVGYIRFKDLASVQNAMPPEAAEARRESAEAVDDSMKFLDGLMKDRWRSGM